MKILYYDCFSGISGDMNLGAMIDLGVPLEHLVAELKKVNVNSYEVLAQRDRRGGITGTRVNVVSPETSPSIVLEHRTYQDIVRLIQTSGLSERTKQTSFKIFKQLAQAEAKVHGHLIDDVRFQDRKSVV